MDLVQKKRDKRERERQRVVNTAWGRNLECEMSNAIAQPTTRTCTAQSYDKAECIPLWGGLTPRLGWTGTVAEFLTVWDEVHGCRDSVYMCDGQLSRQQS